MRTRNAIERLAAVAPPELPVDAAEEERILGHIVAAERAVQHRRRRVPVLLVAAAVIGAAVAAVVTHATAGPRADAGGVHRVALTGASIEMAGYHFQTPAGFASSGNPCGAGQSSSGPDTVANGFSAAASADGGCVAVSYLVQVSDSYVGGGAESPVDGGATPVAVGNSDGFFVPVDNSGESVLYIQLPSSDGSRRYLVLDAEGLTEDQLIAIAESGLPGPS